MTKQRITEKLSLEKSPHHCNKITRWKPLGTIEKLLLILEIMQVLV